MAPRPTWKGYLKLSLVSCAVAMYTATSTSNRIRLNILNRETGNRIRNQAIDSETGDVVENDDKVKGYEVDKGKYVMLEEDELDEVALEVDPYDRHRIVRAARGGRRDLSRQVLYIVPNDEVAYEAFAVIREAMKKKDMVGLGRVVMHRRERLLMLQARGRGIAATALRYKPRCATKIPTSTKFPPLRCQPTCCSLPSTSSTQKKGHFDPDKFEDRYEDALDRADQGKARRQGAARSHGSEAVECHQPDGCAAPQREGREGRRSARTRASRQARALRLRKRPRSTSA